jgi:hypothetical protein
MKFGRCQMALERSWDITQSSLLPSCNGEFLFAVGVVMLSSKPSDLCD